MTRPWLQSAGVAATEHCRALHHPRASKRRLCLGNWAMAGGFFGCQGSPRLISYSLAKFGMISELRWTKWVCLNICPPNPIFARHSHESGRKLCHGRPWPGSPFASWQRRAEHLKASGFFLSSAIWNTWDFSFHLEYLEYSNKMTLKCVSVQVQCKFRGLQMAWNCMITINP